MNSIKKNDLLLDPILNEIFKTDWFGGSEAKGKYLPAVNSKENEKDFELELIVPGRKKEDFTIEIDKHVLTISAKERSEDTTSEKYAIREYVYIAFKRAFVLPKTIDEDKINASYEEGVLKFTFPKKEEALPKPKKLINLG